MGWWTRVFPTSPERQREGNQPLAGARGWWVCALLLMAALLFFARLGTPLQEPQEARFAEVARQMFAARTGIVPPPPGQHFADKPPLLTWLLMGSYRLFGVHDWAARLVAGFAGFATVLLTWCWGRRLFGARTAFAGAMVLCLSAHFVYLGRLLTTDSLLTACVVASWACAHAALQKRQKRQKGQKGTGVISHGWWLLSALACGLGLLTKGPVALVLVVVPLILYRWLDSRTARPVWTIFFLTAIGLAAPWYAAQEAAQPGFLVDFLWRQHFVRFATPFDHEEPVWFFLPRLLLGMLPWTLLLPGFVRFLGRRAPLAAASRPAALGFVLLAFAWSLLFFSASGCKRATYILPVLPPLALALGCYLDAIVARGIAARAGSALADHAAAFACRAVQVVLVAGIIGSMAAGAAGLLRWPQALLLAIIAAGGLLYASRPEWRSRPARDWGLCIAATFLLLFTALYGLLPGYARKFSMRGQVRPLIEESGPIVCYPRRWDSVNFYLGRDDVRVYSADELPQLLGEVRRRRETLVVVKSGPPLESLLANLPSGMEFVPKGRQGTVTIGHIRYREEAPAVLYAHNE